MLGKLKSAKSEAVVEELAKSVPDVLSGLAEEQITAKEKAEEDSIRDIIARMKQALATTAERGLDSQSKFFDWMSCHPGFSFHPVCSFKIFLIFG